MAQKVSGLSTQEANNSERSRKEGRAKVRRQQSRRVGLRPNATPGRYYTRPSAPEPNIKSQQLASALGQLSPTLANLSGHLAEKQRNEAQQQAEAKIASMSNEEARQMVESGEISEYENPYFQEAFQRQYGTRLGLAKAEHLQSAYAEGFNPRTDDVDEFIADQVGPDIQRLQDSPLIQGGYQDALHNALTSVRSKASSDKAGLIEQDKMDGAYETFNAMIQQRLDNASNPQERQEAIDNGAAAIFGEYKANRERLNLTNAEQDAITMQVAARYAREGDRDVVQSLLTKDRGGVPAIINKRGKAGAEAARIVGLSERNFADDETARWEDTRFDLWEDAQTGDLDEEKVRQIRKDHPDALTEAQTRSLIGKNRNVIEAKRKSLEKEREAASNQRIAAASQGAVMDQVYQSLNEGTFQSMPNMTVYDENGKEKTWDFNDLEDKAIESYFGPGGRSERIAQRNNETDSQRFDRELDIASRNNIIPPQWKREINSGATAANIGAILDGKELPSNLKRGYELYQQMRSKAPSMLESVVSSSDTMDFYESMRVAQEYGGQDTERAAQAAYLMNQDDYVKNNPSVQARYDQIDNAVNSVDIKKGFFSDTTGGDVSNSMSINAELRRAARFYSVRSGLSVEDAMEEAKSRVQSNYTVINNRAVKIGGINTPSGFPDMVKDRIQRYAGNHQQELSDRGLGADDISVQAVSRGSTGVWQLVESETGMPLDSRVDGQFTGRDLVADIKARKDKAAADVARGQREKEHHQGGGTDYQNVGQFGFNSSSLEQPRQQEDSSGLSPQEMQAEAPAGAQAERKPLPVPNEGQESDEFINAVSQMKKAGITQSDLDDFLRRHEGDPVRWAGTANNGNPLDTTFAMNPTVREKLRKYLPT